MASMQAIMSADPKLLGCQLRLYSKHVYIFGRNMLTGQKPPWYGI